jgi:hypothetical protein
MINISDFYNFIDTNKNYKIVICFSTSATYIIQSFLGIYQEEQHRKINIDSKICQEVMAVNYFSPQHKSTQVYIFIKNALFMFTQKNKKS